MRAMILAAGLGTRLLPLTAHTPKPLLPLAGEPLLGHQLRALQQAGVREVIINLHHLKEQIRDYVGTGEQFGVSVHYSEEDQLLETGGAIRKVLEHFEDQPFWLLNGDIWSDFDFRSLPRSVERQSAHIVLTPTPAHREKGDFEYADGVVTRRGDTYVYCGIACLHPSILGTTVDAATDTNPDVFSLRDIYFDLIPKGRLHAQVHHGRWHDIGTLAQYEALLEANPDSG